MQVHYDEGIANRIGPESCAGTREGAGEALTGVCIGQPLNRESDLFRVPTPCSWRKATRTGALTQAPGRPGVVGDPGMCRSSLCGNREISRPTISLVTRVLLWSASGRRGAVADDARP